MKPKHLLFTLFFLIVPFLSSAYDFYKGGIYYNINDDGATVAITSGTNEYSGNVVIPSTVTYDGTTYSVTSIGFQGFYGCTGLTSITIPNSVTSIGVYAFSDCTGLTSITIPESVTSIGDNAFKDCTGLTSVYFNAVNCTYMGKPDMQTKYAVFAGCTNLATVNIGENVESIPTSAFNGCMSLTAVCITDIATWCNIDFGHNVSNPLYYAKNLYLNGELVTNLVIPDSVASISSSAFYNCTGLTSVTIPNSVTSIGGSTFYGCTGLTSVTIPNSVTSIGDHTFYDCTRLTAVTIPNSVTSIGDKAFSYCTSLTSITIPESVTEIGDMAFYHCDGLTIVHFNATNCTTMGDFDYPSFGKCSNLTIINIGENVVTIPSYAFYGCTGLTTVNYNAINCTNNMDSSFWRCSNVTTINIGENVEIIPKYAFIYFDNLKNIKILAIEPPLAKYGAIDSEKLETPKEALVKYAVDSVWGNISCIYAIEGNDTIYPVPIINIGDTIVTLQNGDETGGAAKEGDVVTILPIGDKEQMAGIVMHSGKDVTQQLRETGAYSFTVDRNHKNNIVYSYFITSEKHFDITLEQSGVLINKVTIGNLPNVYSLKVTGDINGTDILAIHKMTNLQILDLSEANIVSGGMAYYNEYVTADNVIGAYIFKELSNLKVIKLPRNATKINEYAFSGCTGITDITIPENVTEIGYGAFDNCTNLMYLNIEDGDKDLSLSSDAMFSKHSITSLYLGRDVNMTLSNKQSLTSLTIGDKVTTIGSNAFSGCLGLTSVTIPNLVTSIGSSAFYGCTGLTSITIPDKVTSIGSSAFYDCSLTSINISDGDKTLSLGSNSFYNCPIDSLYMGRNISYTSSSPLGNKSTLTQITIGDKVTSIKSNTFSGCINLATLTLGSKVASIGDNAFGGCDALMEINTRNTTPPDITKTTFSQVDKQACVLYVPIDCMGIYWLHQYWGEFYNIYETDFYSDVKPIMPADNENSIRVENGTIVVTADAVPVTIYNTSGVVVYHRTVNAGERIILPTHGIYLVRVAGKTQKVVL